MTNEEAKKAGFRTASGALYVYWCIENGHIYVRSCDACALTGNDFPTRAKARDALRKRKLEAEHAKWLADMQSQTTPITPEQAKMLREGDSWYYYNPVIKSISECVKLIAINADQSFGRYFTRSAAQAALDKAKAEAEPLEWCEYNEGYRLSPEAFISFDDGKTWTTVTGKFIGVCYSERLGIRARYRNPMWLAKHGNKGMVYNNNTDKWEPEPTKSLDDFPINKEEPAYSTEMHSDTEDLTLQTSAILNHERGKSPSKFISFSNYKGIIPSRFTLDMKNFDLPALQELINTNFVPMFRGQPKEGVTNETQPKALCNVVSHPSHYTSHPSGVECITITKHMNFCRGNAVKYLWRAGQKGDSLDKEIEDIAKAEEYCRIEKERLIATKGAK